MMLRAILTGAVLVALALAILGTLSQPAQADPQPARIIFGGLGAVNTTGETKTDFHVEIEAFRYGNNYISCWDAKLKVDAGPDHSPTIQGNSTQFVTLEWDVLIPNGSIVQAAWSCIQWGSSSQSVTAFFTPQDGNTKVPAVGWQVIPDGTVFLTDAYAVQVSFDDLRLQRPDEITTDSLFDLVGTPSGAAASISSGLVPAGSPGDPGAVLVDTVDLDVGDFLTARVETNFEDPGFSNLDATVVMGYQAQGEPVPVGGIGQLPVVASGGSSAPAYALIAGAAAAAVVALTAGGWYARRRWLG